MRSRGFSLLELLVVVAIVLTMAAVSAPSYRGLSAERYLLAAGHQFRSHFREAASLAISANAYTAIRFEEHSGQTLYALYRDGNGNGVLATEIAAGQDLRIAGPFPLTGGAPSVRVGINPGVPALPGDDARLLTGDPIRFGRSRMVSFSPFGTATPGTFYLAGDAAQAAVRVTGGSARVRLMVCRGNVWRER